MRPFRRPCLPARSVFLALCWAIAVRAIESVSINENNELWVYHSCVRRCLYYPNIYRDMGSAMLCDAPYDNACYCATATPSASRATSWIPVCASQNCAAGDVEGDGRAMQTLYASYCAAAGYLQPFVSEWLAAETTEEPDSDGEDKGGSKSSSKPGATVDDGGPDRTTQTTIVTATDPAGNSAGTSRRGKSTAAVLVATAAVVVAWW